MNYTFAHRGHLCRDAAQMRMLVRLVCLACCSILGAQVKVPAATGHPSESALHVSLVVMPAEWSRQIPPAGNVNYPEFLSTVYPGQKIALGLMATGASDDTLLENAVIRAVFSVEGNSQNVVNELKPAAVRRVKAQGADFVLSVLEAAGLGDETRANTEAATAQQALAVFAPEWIVPMIEAPTVVDVSVEVVGLAEPVAIGPTKLRIKTTAEWLSESPPSIEEFGRSLNRYRSDVAPGQLMAWFVAAAKGDGLRAGAMQAFFALAFRSSEAARDAALAAYPSLDADVQRALQWILRIAGLELNERFPGFATEALATLQAVEPLPDPRLLPRFADPVDVQAVARIGQAMDQCWAGWMATGDPSYLRALVDLLGGASDFPAYKTWRETRGGPKGLNAQVARGLAYQIAGWSTGSFQRTDPLVADWLAFWQNDPSVPALIRREIASLPTNPAFRREKDGQAQGKPARRE